MCACLRVNMRISAGIPGSPFAAMELVICCTGTADVPFIAGAATATTLRPIVIGRGFLKRTRAQGGQYQAVSRCCIGSPFYHFAAIARSREKGADNLRHWAGLMSGISMASCIAPPFRLASLDAFSEACFTRPRSIGGFGRFKIFLKYLA